MLKSRKAIALLMCMLMAFTFCGCFDNVSEEDIDAASEAVSNALEDLGDEIEASSQAAVDIAVDTTKTTLDVAEQTAEIMGGMAKDLATTLPEGVDNPLDKPTKPNDKPTVKADPDELLVASSYEDFNTRVANKETFYVFFGTTADDLCKTLLQFAAYQAKKDGITKIYYVDIWVAGDTRLSNDEAVTAQYKKTLDNIKAILPSDYEMNGEPYLRIPTFIYIENGKATRFTSAVPESLAKINLGPNGEMPNATRDEVLTMLDNFFL